jgi:ubiquinone/menaquinone biosynthesis C-methylase UbiE
MHIHHERIAGIDAYIEKHQHETLDSRIPDFERLIRYIRKGRVIDANTKMLEIGTGTAWFPMLCMANGLQCVGMDISPHLIEHAKELGRRNGYVPEIMLGNVETEPLGVEKYDVIVASSIFEHVQDWKGGLANVYRALKPGGAMFFESTNKFMLNFNTGEYPGFPFYGWLPDFARYGIRKMIHGDDVMKLGIDFHQFTYPLLRRTFREIGFRKVLDVIDLLDARGGMKGQALAVAQAFPPARHLILAFLIDGSTFVCVK